MSRVDVVCAFDAGYAAPAAVALRSAAETIGAGTTLVAHLAGIGLDASTRRRIEASAPSIDVRWAAFEESWLDPIPTPPTAAWPKTAYAPLLSDRFLPDDVTRFVMLDADTLVRSGIDELAAVDLGDATIAAVRDVGIPVIAMPKGPIAWRQLGLDPRMPYFNSGVMVVDRAAWAAGGVERAALDYLIGYGEDVRCVDQEALNVVLAGAWHELPLRWNTQIVLDDLVRRDRGWIYGFLGAAAVDAAYDDPAIIHYTGEVKPWHGLPVRHGDTWRAALARTEFADHAPAPRPSPGPVRVGLRRARRAAGVLLRG